MLSIKIKNVPKDGFPIENYNKTTPQATPAVKFKFQK